MSDNFDKSLENKGWEQMKFMLDGAMPLPDKKRKRRFLFWFFLSGFLLLTTALGTYFFYQKNAEKPAREKIKPLLKNIAATEEKRNGFSENEAHKQNVSTQPSDQSTVAENIEINKKAIFKKSFKNESQIPVNQNFISKNIFENQSQILTQNDLGNNTQIALNALPQSKINPLEIEEKTTLQIPPYESEKKVDVKKSSKVRFGLSGTVSTQSFTALNGFQTGVAVQFSLSEKSKLVTGIQYGQLVKPESTYLESSLLAADTEEVINFDPANVRDIDTELIANGLKRDTTSNTLLSSKKTSFISVPLHYQFRFGEKFSAEIGAEASYYFFEKPAVFYVSSSLDRNNFEIGKLTGNNFEASVSGGVFYHPFSKLEFGFTYRYGITNLSTEPDVHFYNRQIGLTSRYFFN